MERLTGQIITRPMGPASKERGERVLVAVVGIIAVDPGSPLNVEGRQFVVSGTGAGMFPTDTEIVVFTDGSIDRSKEIAGMPLGRALLEPIWRV